MTDRTHPRPRRYALTGRLHQRLALPGERSLRRARAGAGVVELRAAGEASWHPAGRRVRIADADVGSLAVHGVDLGRGPALVLLHGYLQASWCWRLVIEPLAAERRVLAPCLPGFGWSDKPVAARWGLDAQRDRVLAWLDAAGVARADLVGCSLGGALAVDIAAHAPERVRSLTLLNPAGAGRYPMAALAALQREAFAPLVRLPGVPAGLKLGLRLAAYAQLEVDDHYMAHFLAPLREAGAAEVALAVARRYNADLACVDRSLAVVRAPALVIRGDRDRVIPAGVVRRVAAGLRGVDGGPAPLLRYATCGHCPMEEAPARFCADLTAFLREVEHADRMVASL